MLYISPRAGFHLTISVVIGTDCIGSCKSNYHMTRDVIRSQQPVKISGNWTLAVTGGYFFSSKKIMRENLSSISNTTYSACIYWSACLRLQIFTNKHCYISSNPNNISRYFPLIGDEIVERDWIIRVTYSRFFFNFFFRNIAMSSEWRFTKL